MAVEVTVDPEVAKKDTNGDGHISKAEMEMDSQLKGEQQGLRENQFDYKQVLDAQKLQKDYDLANLRANVARERANATKQEG